jgi:hypothetical protein
VDSEKPQQMKYIFLTVILLGTVLAAQGCGTSARVGDDAQPSATSAASPREALVQAWAQVKLLKNPLLEGVQSVEPTFRTDDKGLLGAQLDFIRNAVWPLKGASPVAVDATEPYLWVSLTMGKAGQPAQPTVRGRALRVGQDSYDLDIWVVSSDKALADRINAILAGAFAQWRE